MIEGDGLETKIFLQAFYIFRLIDQIGNIFRIIDQIGTFRFN